MKNFIKCYSCLKLCVIMAIMYSGFCFAQWSGTTTNSRVGIGTNIPIVLLEIAQKENNPNVSNVMLQLTNQYSGTGLNEPTIRFDNGVNGGSSHWLLGAQVSGQEYFRIRCNSWQNGGTLQDVFFINGDGKVVIGDGSISYPGDYKLYVQQGILTERLKIAMSNDPINWADYVFDNDYKLMPLSDVKRYIESEKHLPNMPSTCELAEQGGIDVHKMLIMQQQKIEELYLYMLEFDKKLNSTK